MKEASPEIHVGDPLVVLTGPTAVGKTELSIALAKAIHGEIISADSIQIYKYMDIGSAKIRPEEMDGVPHHLIDVLDPSEEFNIVRFQSMAKEAIRGIRGRGHIPIVVGGTGFYIQGLLYDIDFTDNGGDTSYRSSLEGMEEDVLFRMLREVDPVSAKVIHPHNKKRVVRALEFYHQTGERISDHNAQQRQKKSPWNFEYFVLNRPRAELYTRINTRVQNMFDAGLTDEVKHLKDMGYTRDLVSMQGLGYKELLAALDGEMTLEEAQEVIATNTRHFAKRQLTWFGREKEVTMVPMETFSYDQNRILAFLVGRLREKQIL
ncbi:MAG: tRNA (adenosine(37)-N6)-dimethylallyltransferase MiaA [Lachnospiraceae bacterium]|nr:tRNA (adenosine(37)-N6)-dimethylallyltransferase MiaA [Lachnospiraceae bacterium]